MGHERAAIVGLVSGAARRIDAEHSLEELAGLSEAAGARVVLRVLQERGKPDPATFLGAGKVDALARASAEADVDVVVVDNELSPAQARELHKRLSLKVVDRTQLILDIFARRARTREGKLQVELAQLKYLLPRLVGAGAELSRLGGGIGTRGPGETKLESDRRRIRDRIHALQEGIDDVRRRRAQLRERRQKTAVPTVALVGYTNAGKTTLFNRLTHADALASDALFVTLDPLVRRVRLPDQRELLISDTVGFIDRLPHALVAAFRATLEETAEADLALHIVDASSPERERQMAAVARVLSEVGAIDVPRIDVFNKVDRLTGDERRRLADADPASASISATTGEGCDGLVDMIASRLALDQERVTIAYDLTSDDERRRLAWLYRHARVHSQVVHGDRAVIEADVPRRLMTRARPGRTSDRAGGTTRRAVVMTLMIAALAGACASRPPVMPPPPTTLRHPDFLYPLAPAGSDPMQIDRIERGWRLLQTDNLRGAEREFQAALDQQPAFHPAQAALGYLELARRDAKDAVARFDRALEGASSYTPALAGRGQALLELGREGEALTSLEAALKSNPALTDLQARIDVLRFRALQDSLTRAKTASEAGRWTEARQAYEQAIAASPDSAFLYRDLAMLEKTAGDPAQALQHFERAIALDPTDARSLSQIGALLEERGDAAGALRSYESARAIDPSEVPDGRIERLREAAAAAKLPAEYRSIPSSPSATRGEVAAMLGIRLQALLAAVKPRQTVVTDLRGHWAQPWILAVVRAGVMDTQPNYSFQPGGAVRRGDLAQTVSRVLSVIASRRPGTALAWQNARVKIADVAPAHLNYGAASQAIASGVMPLPSDGTFQLLRPVTGAELVEIIARLEELAAK